MTDLRRVLSPKRRGHKYGEQCLRLYAHMHSSHLNKPYSMTERLFSKRSRHGSQSTTTTTSTATTIPATVTDEKPPLYTFAATTSSHQPSRRRDPGCPCNNGYQALKVHIEKIAADWHTAPTSDKDPVNWELDDGEDKQHLRHCICSEFPLRT